MDDLDDLIAAIKRATDRKPRKKPKKDSIPEFCEEEGISKGLFYALGLHKTCDHVGRRAFTTPETHQTWQALRKAGRGKTNPLIAGDK